jgi:antitoxin VapB
MVQKSCEFLYHIPMSINIKNREAEALLAELKAATGKGTTPIVLELLRDAVGRRRKETGLEERRKLIDEITRRSAAKMTDPRPHDEIIGYDEHGLPR